MKLLKKINRKKIQQAGQGMTEYILLLVVIVAVSMIFKDKIKGAVEGKMNDVSGSIQSFDGK